MENQLIKEIINTEIDELVKIRLKMIRYLTLFEFLPLIISLVVSLLINNNIVTTILFLISLFFILISDYFLFKLFHISKISKLCLNRKELLLIDITDLRYIDNNIQDSKEKIVKYIIKNSSDSFLKEIESDLFLFISHCHNKEKLINLINYRNKRM